MEIFQESQKTSLLWSIERRRFVRGFIFNISLLCCLFHHHRLRRRRCRRRYLTIHGLAPIQQSDQPKQWFASFNSFIDSERSNERNYTKSKHKKVQNKRRKKEKKTRENYSAHSVLLSVCVRACASLLDSHHPPGSQNIQPTNRKKQQQQQKQKSHQIKLPKEADKI